MALMSISFSAKSAAYFSSRSSDRSSSAMARFSAPSASGPGGPGGGGGGGPGRGGGGGGVSPQTGDGSGDTTVWWRTGVAALESFEIDERSWGLTRFPIWPSKIALTIGCVIALLESIRQFVHLCLGNPDAFEAHPDEEEEVI